MTRLRGSLAMVAALAWVAVAPAQARVFDLPVRDAAHRTVPAPAYRGDAFSIRLRPAAATAALRPSGVRASRLGVATVDAVAARLGATFEPEFRGEPSDGGAFASFYVVHVPDGTDLGDALDRFAALGEIERVDPIPIVPVTAVPNDSLWSRSVWFYQPPSRRDLHAPEAWDVTTGDTSIVIAIIDTGVLPYHPDIGGRIAGLPGQIWTNWAERGGVPNVDDDHNGFVDDTWGWDFVALMHDADVRAGEDGFDEDNDPNDFVGHGTNVAGVIGAIANNGSGLVGTAWSVRLMVLRVGWASNAAPTGEIDLSYAAEAMNYAVRMGARIVNCSFSTEPFLPLDFAAGEASRAGVLVVAAAGNNGSLNSLGVREDVLTVSSIDRNDKVSRFSNTAPWVDVAAPGEDLATTSIARPGTDSLGVRQPAYTSEANGTSFAAPFAAGAAALVQSRRLMLGDRLLTPQEMILHLRETTDDIAAANPGLTGFGTGRLNLARAVTQSPASRVVHGAALTVGPAVTMVDDTGHTRIAMVTSDARFIVLEGASGETLLTAPLPAAPASGLAAADMGGGIGPALFVGLTNGRVAGFTPAGVPLPHWPVVGISTAQSFTSVALGDLDGDGVLEVVAVGPRDGVMARHADGSSLTGFPRLGFEGVTRAVALSDLDGQPGVEIIVATRDGWVHALSSTGFDIPGWPIGAGGFIPAAAPVVTRFGAETEPTVIVADGPWLRALRGNGSLRWRVPLWNYDVRDPAVGDMNGDGSDEIVVASGPLLAVFDSLGAALPGRWPFDDRVPATSDPIIGWSGGATPGIVLRGGLELRGFDVGGQLLWGYPKPGFAGQAPTLTDLDGDDATEMIAGTGIDSLIYLYDLGPGTWHAAPQPWPTPRGNDARTGSRLYTPGLSAIDGMPPMAVSNLGVLSTGVHEVTLTWTAPADPPTGGPVATYDLRRAATLGGILDFATATPVDGLPVPAAPGTSQAITINGLAEGGRYWFAIRSRDQTGNRSPVSGSVVATLHHEAPGIIADLTLESARDTTVTLNWTATGDDGEVGRPLRYHVHAATSPIDESDFDDAPFARIVPATVGASQTEHVIVGGMPRGARLWIALKAEDAAGTFSPMSNVVTATTSVGGPLEGRVGLALASGQQPARAPVALWWQAPDANGARRRIELFDLRGRRVRAIDLGVEAGGIAAWDGRDDRGVRVGAGLYFARLTSGEEIARARIVLLP